MTTIIREASQAQRYIAAWKKSREDLFSLSDTGAKRLASLISRYREETDKILRANQAAADQPFTARIIPDFSRSLKSATDTLSRTAGAEARQGIAAAWENGRTAPADALRATGIQIAAPEIAPELLRTLADMSGNLMTEFTSGIGNRIMAQIQSGILQLKPASQVRNEIEEMLATSGEYQKGKRQRVGLGYQAEEIQRTELNRAYSTANQNSSEQIGRRIPGLRKRWVATPGARQGHAEAERRYDVGGEIGPIPIEDKFEVMDYSRTGPTEFLTFGRRIQPRAWTVSGLRVVKVPTYSRTGTVITDYMLHPHDPTASPGAVINCRCTTINILPTPSEIVVDDRPEDSIEESVTLKEYSPDQPRDDAGQWTSGGGGSGGAGGGGGGGGGGSDSGGPFISGKQTDTPEFKEWFGDSKVVDDDGKPLVVYKGMNPYDWTKEKDGERGPEITSINRTTEFPAFNGDEPGVKVAGFFGDQDTANRFAALNQGSAVYPTYLSFQNPHVIDAKGELAGNIQFGKSGKPFRDAIRSGKFDSVIIRNTKDEGTIYVALKPGQIKSATGNRGTFNPKSPNINESESNEESVTLKEYSPDQPRDDAGQWTSGGGGSGGAGGGGGGGGGGSDSGGPFISGKQTDTKEFKEWFGDSKIVDANGNPQVLYHGTPSVFVSFDVEKTKLSSLGSSGGLGIHMTKNPQEASHYAGKSGSVMPVYVRMTNPKVIERYSVEYDKMFNSKSDSIALRKDLISKGYDGAITPLGEIVAFHPTQIKSATGNRGTFNPKSPNINESESK